MSRRGDNIHKRKDGRWEGRYQLPSNTSPRYKSVYGKTYKETKEKLDNLRKEGIRENRPQLKERTMNEVISLWYFQKEVTLKGATRAKYTDIIDKHIRPHLGKMKISEVTNNVLAEFQKSKLRNGGINSKEGLSVSYVKTMMLVVSSVLKYAFNEGFCMPFNINVPAPQRTKQEIRIIDANSQRKLLSYINSNPDKTGTGILLSLYAGLRIGEICALTWNDINLEDETLKINHTIARVKSPEKERAYELIIDTPKTMSSLREIPISSLLLANLKECKEQSSSNFVISDNSSFINPRTFEYRFHKLLDMCQVENINFHALRHTFATRCVESGVDIKSLSEMLGHSNVSITLNTYVHSSIDLKKIQLEKMAI